MEKYERLDISFLWLRIRVESKIDVKKLPNLNIHNWPHSIHACQFNLGWQYCLIWMFILCIINCRYKTNKRICTYLHQSTNSSEKSEKLCKYSHRTPALTCWQPWQFLSGDYGDGYMTGRNIIQITYHLEVISDLYYNINRSIIVITNLDLLCIDQSRQTTFRG